LVHNFVNHKKNVDLTLIAKSSRMKKYLLVASLITIGTGIHFGFNSHDNYVPVTKTINRTNIIATPAENYANYCAGCHGEKMDAFTDRQWKHGNKLQDLIKAIKNGYADEGMPAFGKRFTDTEIKELSEYILKGIKNVEAYNFDNAPLGDVFKSEKLTVKIEPVATDIDVPWGIAFLPDGALLVTNRDGQLYRVKDKKKVAVTGVPEVLAEGQGGLLDVVLHPDFKTNNFVYISYSKPKKIDGKTLATTAVMRAKLDGDKLTGQTIIFEALPYAPTRHHYGSRLVFDANGLLFVSVGERGNEKLTVLKMTVPFRQIILLKTNQANLPHYTATATVTPRVWLLTRQQACYGKTSMGHAAAMRLTLLIPAQTMAGRLPAMALITTAILLPIKPQHPALKSPNCTGYPL
jgi:cytochrome c553